MDYGRVVDEIFGQITGVRFDVELWDGRRLRYGSGRDVSFTLAFAEERAAKRLLAQGALGFGEAYMDGTLSVTGDLEAYLRLRHQFRTIKKSPRMVAAAALAMRSVPKKTADQISYHYDIGNDFFGLLLDGETMSYSAGRYDTGIKTLAAAQRRKLQLVCDWLDLPKGARVLDLGSGWGGFATYAAVEKGWSVTGLTLSRAQLAYCREAAAAAKLGKHITYSYKDMLYDIPARQFDAVVMIESVEHVGKERLEDYFARLYGAVKPGGSLYIQMTGQYKLRRADKWTLKYVFPGGYLPSIGELVDAAGKAGFTIGRLQDDTPDYLQTMSAWLQNLEKNQSRIEQRFDESFYRLWYLWMHGAKVAFEIGYMNLFRIHFTKPV